MELEVCMGHGWIPEAGSELGWVLLPGPQLYKSLEFTGSQVEVAEVKEAWEAHVAGVSAEAEYGDSAGDAAATEASFESGTLEFPGLTPQGILAKEEAKSFFLKRLTSHSHLAKQSKKTPFGLPHW